MRVIADASVGYGGNPRRPRMRIVRKGFLRYSWTTFLDGEVADRGRALTAARAITQSYQALAKDPQIRAELLNAIVRGDPQ